jgi:hypothetical protein
LVFGSPLYNTPLTTRSFTCLSSLISLRSQGTHPLLTKIAQGLSFLSKWVKNGVMISTPLSWSFCFSTTIWLSKSRYPFNVTGLNDHSYSNLSRSLPAHGREPPFLGVISTIYYFKAVYLYDFINLYWKNLPSISFIFFIQFSSLLKVCCLIKEN